MLRQRRCISRASIDVDSVGAEGSEAHAACIMLAVVFLQGDDRRSPLCDCLLLVGPQGCRAPGYWQWFSGFTFSGGADGCETS